jgi:hypothetical protein
MKKNIAFPLLCCSLIFFFIVGLLIASWLRPLGRLDGDILLGIIPALLGIVSLSGTLLVLREARDISKFWFLGIPHAIILIAVCLAGPAFLILGKHTLAYVYFPQSLGIEYVFIPTALLSLTSICFFPSFLDPKANAAQIFMFVSGVISLFAIIGIYYAVLGIMSPLRTSWNVVTALEMIYWMFLMPIIGLCYVASAFLVWKSPSRS